MADASQLPGVVKSYHLINEFRKNSKKELATNLSTGLSAYNPNLFSMSGYNAKRIGNGFMPNFSAGSLSTSTPETDETFIKNADKIIADAVNNPEITARIGDIPNEEEITAIQKGKKPAPAAKSAAKPASQPAPKKASPNEGNNQYKGIPVKDQSGNIIRYINIGGDKSDKVDNKLIDKIYNNVTAGDDSPFGMSRISSKTYSAGEKIAKAAQKKLIDNCGDCGGVGNSWTQRLIDKAKNGDTDAINQLTDRMAENTGINRGIGFRSWTSD